jgi:putative ABC transport system permease protein
MRNVSQMDMGFDLENRLTLTTDTSLLDYDEDKGRAFQHDLLDRVRALPGVRSAATSRFIPMGFENGVRPMYVEGKGETMREDRPVAYNVVSTDYFAAMGIPILEGRGFSDEDTESSRKVAIVNETMGEVYWPEGSPIGKRFSTEGPGGPFMEVVGIAKQSTYALPGEPDYPYFYMPLTQDYRPYQILLVHTDNEPTPILPAIRAEIQALDPNMPIFEVRTLESHIRDGKAEILFKLPAKLVGAFAFLGAALAGLGLYGVIAYSVTQRAHEIGIRVALGASSASVIRLVLSKGVVLGAFGVGLGLVLALGITRFLANLLVGVRADHLPTYAFVSLAVMLVVITACYIPARFRAARIDAVIALREE